MTANALNTLEEEYISNLINAVEMVVSEKFPGVTLTLANWKDYHTNTHLVANCGTATLEIDHTSLEIRPKA